MPFGKSLNSQDLHLHIKWANTTLAKSAVKIGVLQQVTDTETDTKNIAEWDRALALALGFHGEVEVRQGHRLPPLCPLHTSHSRKQTRPRSDRGPKGEKSLALTNIIRTTQAGSSVWTEVSLVDIKH